MENEIIRVLFYAVVIEALGIALLYLTARGLPIVPEVYSAFWGAVGHILQPLRDVFNADTKLAKMLQSRGVDPAIADMLAEMAADKLEDMAKPYLKETI